MISIVICSNNDDRFAAVSRNLEQLLRGEPHEIIRIPDARSMGEGYVRGVGRSRGESFIFCHDDIQILSPDFAVRLREHLEQFDLVGVAGTDCLFRGKWVAAGRPHIFGQVTHPHPRLGFRRVRFRCEWTGRRRDTRDGRDVPGRAAIGG